MTFTVEERKIRRRAASARWSRANPEKCRAACSAFRAKNPHYQVEWNRRNPERKRAIAARTYAKQETKDRLARWRVANPDKVKAAHARANEKDPPRDRQARFRTTNPAYPEIARLDASLRRARKRGNIGKLSRGLIDLLFSEQGGKCPYCNDALDKKTSHLDHFMPLALGGKNTDENMQLTCPTCNLRKAAKHPALFLAEVIGCQSRG